MKNVIPIVVAVILALAAVIAVSRMKTDRAEVNREERVQIVAAARDLSARETLKEGYLVPRTVPRSALPAQSIPWSQVNMVVGQDLLRSVAKGDYVFLNDIGMNRSLSNLVGAGEWAVPVTFSDDSLLQFLQPGDEIAIWGTYTSKKTIPSADLSTPPTVVEESATSVVFPCVRILDIGMGDGIRREEGVRNKTIIVSLPPQQAGLMIAAQRAAELYPALRHANDATARNRLDGGIINDSTFSEARNGLVPVKLPEIPDKKQN